MREFVLALDVGNTSVAGGLFEGRELRRAFRLASDPTRGADEYGVLLRQLVARETIGGAVICSVVPALTEDFRNAVETYLCAEAVLLKPPYRAAGIEVQYADENAVGADRVVNALAARELYGAPAIVVDFGTATTFDVVSREGAYVGGVIAPGVEISARTLFAKAARLSAVSLTMPERVVGDNTDDALRIGIVLGAARAADGIVRAIWEERHERGSLLATGGLARVVAPHMETAPRLDENLTLKGLILAYERLKGN